MFSMVINYCLQREMSYKNIYVGCSGSTDFTAVPQLYIIIALSNSSITALTIFFVISGFVSEIYISPLL